MLERSGDKAALCGEPSYVWRAGQQRRLELILHSAGERVRGRVLDNGCGIGMYIEHLAPHGGQVTGLEFDLERALEARKNSDHILNAAGEALPFPSNQFDLILSHEVIEHVRDDRQAVAEMVRSLKPGGRLLMFCPNRGYPFETHGIFWRGQYIFGNILFVNYLPRFWRNRLAPHVRAYSTHDLENLFYGLPVRRIQSSIIFGGYDNLIARFKLIGKLMRSILQFLERTPLKFFGLSHFWVVERL
jgi:SAM-dependent methyltransferase